MAYLDNSGDIILDAVLTDTGRMRLARGDGSFKIVKFALGDDEIDYSTYNLNHASGSAYYDLEILQTPILEAFTNNRSLLKSKLVSYSRTNLIYLPVTRWFTNSSKGTFPNKVANVLVDEDTETLFKDLLTSGQSPASKGYILGSSLQASAVIVLEQGLDTTEISYLQKIDPDLKESQYILEIDNRFGKLVSDDALIEANPSFIDDDNIASYYLSLNTDPEFVQDENIGPYADRQNLTAKVKPSGFKFVAGPFGSALMFSIRASIDLQSSNYLFTRLGSTTTPSDVDSTVVDSTTVYKIDSTVRITGATTGYTIDIPVRFLKKA